MDTGKHIYETIFVLHPELAEEEVEANIQNIVGLLEGKSSEIIRIERGGKRRLAYVVQKQRYGYYNLLHFHATPAALTELERLYRLSERVIRYLTVRFDKEEQLTGFARLADDDGQDEERDDRRRGGRRGDFFRPRPRGRETHRAADDLPEEDGDPEEFEEIAGRV